MFTPPPSPLPTSLEHPDDTPSVSSHLLTLPASHQPSTAFKLASPPALARYPTCERRADVSVLAIHDRKRQMGWRTYLMAITVPLFLVLVTLSTHYLTPSRLMDLVAGLFPSRSNSACGANWISDSVHPLQRRQDGPSSASTSGILFPSIGVESSSIPPTPTQSTTSSVPTIPASSPVLPTPFPQPFDTTLANNFTTNSCQTFFTNMTQSLPFRQCRPFSFLSQTSSAFLQVSGSDSLTGYQIRVLMVMRLFIRGQAQSNLTALNIDIWGTCNTPVDADQCEANMGWFALNFPIACSQEKSEQNQMVLQALAGIFSFFSHVI